MNPADDSMSPRVGEPRLEFLVKPFAEDQPGPHVHAAVDAVSGLGLNVDVGAFATATTGEIADLADATRDLIMAAFANGATSIQLNVGVDGSNIGAPSLHTALDDMVRATEAEFGSPVSQWSRSQKQAAVRIFNDQGAFLLRGATDDVAAVMGVSRITIYNYINAIESD